MPNRRDDNDDGSSPWATDEILTGPAPTFEWNRTEPDNEAEARAASEPTKRNSVLVALGCTAALIVGTAILWPRDADPSGATNVDVAPETTLGTLPSTSDDVETGDPDAAPSAPVRGDDTEGVLAPPTQDSTDDVGQIDLPDPVAAISAPTELVMVTTSEIVTLSLPSGLVRRVELVGPTRSEIVVAPDASAVLDENGLNIVPRVGPSLQVDVGSGSDRGSYLNGWDADETGATRFFVETFGPGDDQRFTVGVDGEQSPYEPDPSRAGFFSFFGNLRSQGGEQIVNDAGGVYVIAPDGGVERLSTGQAVAANPGFVLLRECDAQLACGYSILNRETGERQASTATTEQLAVGYGFDLAPDGTSALVDEWYGDERRLIDLSDGDTIATSPTLSGSSRNTRWAADSSGVFMPGMSSPGITFLDRTSGELVQFGTELGQILELGVRMPDTELDAFDNIVATRSFGLSVELSEPAELDVVVLSELGSMALLDLDETQASVWTTPTARGRTAPDLFAIGSEVIVVPENGTRGFVTTFGHSTPIELAEGVEPPESPRFPGPTPDVMWTSQNDGTDGVEHQVVQIRDGALPADGGGAVQLTNSELLGEDGTGQLVARLSGAVHVVGVTDTSKLTDGDLLALGPDHALVRTCDETLRCSVDRIVRETGAPMPATGEQLPETVDVLATAHSVGDPQLSPRLSGTISPNGDAAFVSGATAENVTKWWLVDFVSGRHFEVPAPAGGQPILWNAQASAATYLSDGSVVVIDRQAEQTATVVGLGAVHAITSVGAAFADE